MNQVGIEAKVPGKDGAPDLTASVMVNWADNIEEAVQMFGAEAILTNAFANWRVTIQSNIRAGLKRGETAEQIQARLAGAKMGVAQAGAKIDPAQAFMAQFAAATPEKQKELLDELRKRAQKK